MSEYIKINAPFKRWRKDLHTEEMKPQDAKWNSFKQDEWADESIEYLQNNQWEWTEKLDGTNIRIYIKDNKITIKGRTDKAEIPSQLEHWIKNWFLDNRQEISTLSGAILYGEGVGEKIQKGGKFGLQHFILFDILIESYWLKRDVVAGIAKRINLKHSPVIFTGTIHDAITSVKTLPTSVFGDFTIEGYVGAPAIRLNDQHQNRIITKIKVKDFT